MYKALSKLKSAVFCFLVLMVLLCSCKAQPTWQEQYDLGMRYLTESNYEQAILAFTAAIEINPNQAGAYVGRADAYVGWGDVAGENYLIQAQNDYEQALRLDDSIADVYLYLAEIYTQQGENEKAIDLLLRGYEITGDERLYQEVKEQQTELSFEYSKAYRTFDSLPESGQQALRNAIAALRKENRDDLYDALINSELPTFLRTEMDGVRIELQFADNGSFISLETRPEQGDGYAYEYIAINGTISYNYSSFACVGWQCNGEWHNKQELRNSNGSITTAYIEAAGTAVNNQGTADKQWIRQEYGSNTWNEIRAENGVIVEFTMDSATTAISDMLDPALGLDMDSIGGSEFDMFIFQKETW